MGLSLRFCRRLGRLGFGFMVHLLDGLTNRATISFIAMVFDPEFPAIKVVLERMGGAVWADSDHLGVPLLGCPKARFIPLFP